METVRTVYVEFLCTRIRMCISLYHCVLYRCSINVRDAAMQVKNMAGMGQQEPIQSDDMQSRKFPLTGGFAGKPCTVRRADVTCAC